MIGTHPNKTATAVALVLDSEFGSRIKALVNDMPVWIIDSPINVSAVNDTRNRRTDLNVTIFYCFDSETEGERLLRVLYALDEHEGPASRAIPYEQLLIFGGTLDEIDRATLCELGFTDFHETLSGYQTRKRDPMLPV